MSRYDELQKAAAYAAQDTIKFADEDEEMRALQQFHEEVDPETVLALIAENGRLRESDQEATELCDTLSVLLGEIAVAVRGPEEPKSRHGFHDLPSRVKTVVAERDQLKAENERQAAQFKEWQASHHANYCKVAEERDELRAEIAGLKTGYEAYERVNAELKAENESLRRERDARHPFKPFHEPAIGFTGCVICGVYTDHGGLPCPKTRASADAAMGKGERHERD